MDSEYTKMELLIPKIPRHLDDEFFEELKQNAIKGAYGYDPGEGMSCEPA